MVLHPIACLNVESRPYVAAAVRVGGEDAGRGGPPVGARHLGGLVAVVAGELGVVDAVDQGGAQEGAQVLRQHVVEHLPPDQLAQERHGGRHGRVQVRAGHAAGHLNGADGREEGNLPMGKLRSEEDPP